MDAETSRFSGPKVEAWEPNDEGRPDGRPSRSRSAGLQGSCKSYALVGLDSGGGIRTRDLRVMRSFKGMSYLLICRDFLILSELVRGSI